MKKFVCCMLLCTICLAGCGNESQTTGAEQKDVAEEVKEEVVEEQDSQNTAESAELYTGTFTVGTDVVAGRYVITAPSGLGNFTMFAKDGVSNIIEMLGTDDTMGGELGVSKIIADLSDGDSIQISSLNSVLLEPAEMKTTTTLCAGNFIVGRDVPSGDYIATTPSGSGNFTLFAEDGISNVIEILGVENLLGESLGVEKIKFSARDGDRIFISALNEVILQ